MYRWMILCILLASTSLYAKKEAEYIFPNWKNTYKLNSEAFESEGHNAYIDIYLNELAKEPYIKEYELFPIGSLIFKPLFDNANRDNFARLVIMMKMKPGYDSKHGDWWYGVYDESGTVNHHEGKIHSCIVCHEEGRDTDYTFSESVNLEISRLADRRRTLLRMKNK